jgi:hypothetical protein
MPKPDPVEVEYRILKLALSGQMPLQVGMNNQNRHTQFESVGAHGTWILRRIYDMEEKGLIAGWTPVLTEKGLARGRPRSGWVAWGEQAEATPGNGGRPRTNHFDREEAVRLRARGWSWGSIATQLGASREAVRRAVERAVSNPQKTRFDTPFGGGSAHPELGAE